MDCQFDDLLGRFCYKNQCNTIITVGGTRLTLREKLIKIGAKVIRHGRYVIFQLAEVAISRALFAEILRLIDRLRPTPLPP